ncbi:hypothetical protein [Nocardioides perillae]|uniref:ARB-07466-like C-terminal domain-containing protein n=1 Tax=Nocardioides perillae TaxID=1119534 RepID=A0A7Y9RU62_9ACTN|nr:hypothetical protein [Nocardioides perillae]NYG56691.1 hypothetical protein [Nocardioides perillae]
MPRSRSPWKPVAATVAVVVAATAVGLGVREGVVPVPGALGGEGCTARVDGHTVELSLEQAEHAALIAGTAVARDLPARAASIALATAYQESDLENVEYGDRDSLGLFQQRPSQGWGTPTQVLDPVYATNRFYDALVEVDGYRDMRITEAAQEVQRSGFPEAYEDHADDARALASALTGYSEAAFTCTVDLDAEEETDRLDRQGLTPRAATVREELEAVFGRLSLGGFAPGGVSSGHSADSAHYDGRAVDVFFRPVGGDRTRRGWAVAQYLVAQADRLGVATVIFDEKIWTARRSSQGWRDYDLDTGGVDRATAAILLHRDHVHVDVAD